MHAAAAPKISVIIPIYNMEKYLRRCLASVVGQTFSDLEILCVNDGSTDSSLSIVEEFAEKDRRVRLINTENCGYGHAMNLGMEAATGKYIGIVESDDFIAKNMYSVLWRLTLGGKADVAKGNFYDYYAEDGQSPRIEVNHERDTVKDSESPFALRENAQISWGHPSVWSAIYRREFLIRNRIRFIEAKGGGWVDNPFFYETLCQAKSIMWTGQPLYYYRKSNPESSSNRQMDPRLPFVRMMENLDILEKHGYRDAPSKRCAYARALMYLTGAVQDFDSDKHASVIHDYAQRLMRRLDERVISSDFNVRDRLTYFTYASPLKRLQDQAPRILLYNWTPFDNPWGFGGGVTIYCKNLIEEILGNTGAQVYFLSSGFAYTATKKRTFLRKLDNALGDRVHQYEIVNSPVPADQRCLYVNPLVALENRGLQEIFASFLASYGPFAVVHFQNIEGLSLDVLDLKKQFPETRFLYSMHNYVPICATGTYYMRHRHSNCHVGRTGMDCFACTRADIRRELAKEVYERGKYGQEAKECISMGRWVKSFGFERLDVDVSPETIQEFSRTAVAKINENCDHILAVSERVREIAVENGMDAGKVSVSYIGTRIAENQRGCAGSKPGNGLRIVFLGSDINYEEKGYAFLLDALAQLAPEYAARIDLLLTVKQEEHAEIKDMLHNYRSVKVVQGYAHEDLAWIFEGAHLSIVPVLWEDNLPQIAIESVAYGVPVLASTAGGAKELCDSKLFRFACGDAEDLRKKIVHFGDHPKDLQEYWKHHHGLVTMRQHWEELSGLYGMKEERCVSLPREDYLFLLRENEFLRRHVALDGKRDVPSPVLEDLRQKLHAANEEKERLGSKVKELEEESMGRQGKVIFQTEKNPIMDTLGATLFRIVLSDFNYNDFYAEIQFVHLSNIAPSYTDTLRLSGTLLGEDEERSIQFHQSEWEKGDTELSQEIRFWVEKNQVVFFGQHNGRACGYFYQVNTLASRALHDAVRMEKVNDGFVFEGEVAKL